MIAEPLQRRASHRLKCVVVTLGLVSVAIVALHTFFFVVSLWRDFTLVNLRGLLFRWQTLSGAVLALLAAFEGLCAIYYQVTVASEREHIVRANRAAATRATLPLWLPPIYEYAEQSWSELLKILDGPDAKEGQAVFVHPPKFPKLPPDLPSIFRNLWEDGDQSLSIPLGSLATLLQIQKARLQTVAERYDDPNLTITYHNVRHYLIDTAEIFARLDALLVYARGEGAEPRKIGAPEVMSSVRQHLSDPAFAQEEKLREIVERRASEK